jgi:replicative DNA helicase
MKPLPLPEDEAAVVAAMILDHHRIDEVVPIVTASDFTDTRLREIFVTVADLHESGATVDVQTTVTTMKDAGRFEPIGGAPLFGQISGAIGTPSNATYYAGRVRNASIIAKLQSVLSEATARTASHDAKPADLLDFIDSRLLELRDIGTATDSVKTIADVASQLCDEIDAASAAGISRGLRTGLDCFDRINGGYQNGNLNVIAARPSNGKSVLGQQFAESVGSGFQYSIADEQNYFVQDQPPASTLFISLEMTEAELASRSLAAATSIDGRKINSYRVTQQQRQQLRQAAAEMSGSRLHLWEPHRATVSNIRAKARLHQRQHGLDFLLIDYLQLIDSERGTKHDKETYRIGEICRHLKQLAKELSIPVVVLCQLNRDAESRGKTSVKPSLSQLADSGKIEQHADTVTAIHRAERTSNEAQLSILKWRNGQLADVDITFDQRHCRFTEMPIEHHAN